MGKNETTIMNHEHQSIYMEELICSYGYHASESHVTKLLALSFHTVCPVKIFLKTG
jgi:hypothetical protein